MKRKKRDTMGSIIFEVAIEISIVKLVKNKSNAISKRFWLHCAGRDFLERVIHNIVQKISLKENNLFCRLSKKRDIESRRYQYTTFRGKIDVKFIKNKDHCYEGIRPNVRKKF